MSGLQRVSFRKGRQHLPRLSALYVPGVRAARFWTDAEKAIVRKYYPAGGSAACLAHLGRRRTPQGVYQIAKKLDLTTPHGLADYKGNNGKVVVPAGFDAALRAFYREEGDGKKRGECNAFADKWRLPRWWVTKRATKLGLVMPHRKEPPWTRAEEALLARVPLHDLDRCAKIFREHGFARSPTAIKVKTVRLDLRRRYNETFSATAVSRILGVDGKSVTREILQGDLVAVKRPTRRLPQQGGDPWSIERAALRAYIVDHLERIDLRKVDKFAFVDVLTNDGRTSARKPDGRSRPWTPERRAAQARRMRRRWRKARSS